MSKISAKEKNVQRTEKPKSENTNNQIFLWLSIGIAIGTSLGIVFHNIPFGVALGISIGLIIGASLAQKNKKS